MALFSRGDLSCAGLGSLDTEIQLKRSRGSKLPGVVWFTRALDQPDTSRLIEPAISTLLAGITPNLGDEEARVSEVGPVEIVVER